MYSEQELNISGKRSVAFMGREIAFVSSRETSEDTYYEWDALKIYEIDPEWALQQEKNSGRKIDPYTVGIARCTKWMGSRDRYRVFHARTLKDVLGIVHSRLPVFDREVQEQLKLNNEPLRNLGNEPRRSSVVS